MWPDCPYKIYLLTNNKKYIAQNVTSLCVGNDTMWGENLTKALKKITENYVLTTFDDLFFTSNINTNKIYRLFELFKEKNMNYLKLNYPRKYDLKSIENHTQIGEIPRGISYRSSAVATIWKKAVLLDINDNAYSAWDFEIKGSNRTNKYDKWYGSLVQDMPFLNLIIKGKCDPNVYKYFKEKGIDLSDDRLVIMNYKDQIRYELRKKCSALFHRLVPNKKGARIREKFHLV
jgi:hypothetical protein